MAERRCSMVVGWMTNEHGNPDEDYPCGKSARRALGHAPEKMAGAMPDAGHWLDGCCDECFGEMAACGDFTKDELDEMYPLVASAA